MDENTKSRLLSLLTEIKYGEKTTRCYCGEMSCLLCHGSGWKVADIQYTLEEQVDALIDILHELISEGLDNED